MPASQTKQRIKRIQKHLKVTADGVIGSNTLTVLENALFSKKEAESSKTKYSLMISKKGFQALVRHEIISKKYYERRLQRPTWPGGASGVTIGIGYDLGYNSPAQIRRDWQAYLSSDDLERLVSVSRKKAASAKQVLATVRMVRIPFAAANEVFSVTVLPRHAALTRKAYPGIHKLLPDAQTAILSLVYNRGTAMSGSRRKEMKALRLLVKKANYSGIAQQLTAMKRLWENKGLDGLLKRRDAEAKLVLHAAGNYDWKNLIRV